MLLLAVGAFVFLQYGGTTTSINANAGLLKVANPAMDEGNPHAPVKMVEYADFLCPYCSKFAHDIMPSIQSEYVTAGKVQVEFRPVAVIAPDSQRAAEGAYCAAEQHKFWNYYNAAYNETWNNYYSIGKKPADIPLFHGSAINTLAAIAGLNTSTFSVCINSGKYTAAIQENTKAFEGQGFSGTPAFLVNDTQYEGYAPYNVVKPIIESYLKK